MASISLGNTLFGSKPKAEQFSLPELSPEQEAALKQLLGVLGPNAPGASPLTSPAFTSLSPAETTSLAGLEQLALNFAQPTDAATTSQDALKRIIDTGDKGFADFYRTNIAEPVSRTFNEEILPGINRQYSNQFFGTDRGDALDRSQQRVLQALTQGAGQALKDFRGETISAAGALPTSEATSTGASVQALLAALQGGGVPRGVATTERDKQLQALLAALGIKTKDNTVVALPGQAGLLQAFVGGAGEGFGAAGGAAAGAAAFSDRRLKTNIRRIATHRLGIGIYSYTIFGRPTVGVMADEVLTVVPAAVIRTPNGFLAVNYAML